MLLRKELIGFTNKVIRNSVAKVATWNALASSFNFAPQKKYNFWSQNVGLFEISKLDNPEGFRCLKVGYMQLYTTLW